MSNDKGNKPTIAGEPEVSDGDFLANRRSKAAQLGASREEWVKSWEERKLPTPLVNNTGSKLVR